MIRWVRRRHSLLATAAEDTIFVGDRVREDVRGPQLLGMRGVLTHEFRQEDSAGSAPHAVIQDLRELLDIVQD